MRQIGIGLLGFVHVDDLVFGIGEYAGNPILEVPDFGIPAQFEFETFVVHPAQVRGRKSRTHDRGDGSVIPEDVVAFFPEIVSRETQLVVEHFQVESDIGFLGPFPGHVGVADASLGGGGIVLRVLPECSEVVAVRTVYECRRQVEIAVAADLVVSDFSV